MSVRGDEVGPEVISIAVDIDGNGVKLLRTRGSVKDLLARMKDGEFVYCHDDELGDLYVSPSYVRYFMRGRGRLPVSAAPSSTASAEHAALVSGVHQ